MVAILDKGVNGDRFIFTPFPTSNYHGDIYLDLNQTSSSRPIIYATRPY